jgi:hypothetical protein
MKKTAAVFIMLLSFFCVLSAEEKNADAGGKKENVPVFKSVDNAVIDGALDSSVKTDPLIIGTPDKKGLPSGKIYLGYDSGDIYIYADINDPRPGINNFKGADITKADSLVFTISTDPGAAPGRKTPGNFDFYFAIKASSNTETWSYTRKAPLQNPILFYRQKPSGYVIEALIPWYNFNTGCFCKIKNKAISFDAAINSLNAGGAQIQTRYLGGTNFTSDPSQWGHVIFSTK